ncbi:TPA: hypothetical protein SAN82_001185 [Pseudomonas putida]|nr:hypothetical protein [Pseudomonas putida]
MSGLLFVTVTGSAEGFDDGKAYAVLGEDAEKPDLKGTEISFSVWEEGRPPNEPEDGRYVRSKNLVVELSTAQLKKFAGQTVQVRYAMEGTSGLIVGSEPISLKIS